jgi:hypothetical protein
MLLETEHGALECLGAEAKAIAGEDRHAIVDPLDHILRYVSDMDEAERFLERLVAYGVLTMTHVVEDEDEDASHDVYAVSLALIQRLTDTLPIIQDSVECKALAARVADLTARRQVVATRLGQLQREAEVLRDTDALLADEQRRYIDVIQESRAMATKVALLAKNIS